MRRLGARGNAPRARTSPEVAQNRLSDMRTPRRWQSEHRRKRRTPSTQSGCAGEPALRLFGRKHDLAFEQDVGGSADKLHHVRWWRAEPLDAAGRPLWIGSATFDRDAGISHLTGQITHHIAPDIDAERDRLMADRAAGNWLVDQV